MNQSDTTESATGSLVRLALWGGLVYGFIEALEFGLLGLVPGALSWRNGNAPPVFWVAPLVYGTVFTMIGLLAAGLARIWPRWRWDAFLVAGLVFLGAWLAGTLQGQLLSTVSATILALGFAVLLTRHYRGHTRSWHRLIRTTLPALLIFIPILTVLITGWGILRERAAVADLPPASPGAPNVLLLVMDTQRADHMSLYGYHRETTPELERFATGATVFSSAVTPSSWTLPSHASMMTGRLLHEHRAGIMRRPFLDERFPTLAEVLAGRGYATAGFVANTFWCGRQTGLARGFIHYEDFYGNVADAISRTVLGRKLAYEVFPRLGFKDVPGRKWSPEINEDFLSWLDDRDENRPFFAFLNYFDVHSPLLPPPPFGGRFSPGGEPVEYSEIEIGALVGEMKLPPPRQLQAMVNAYDESILYLDSQMGVLFDTLRELGILDETIVIITSDHGESWGEHGMMYHGHSLYADQIMAPLIVRYPGHVPAGARISRTVGVEGIPSTVMGLLEANGPFGGEDLLAGGGSPVLTELGQRAEVPAGWPASRGSVAALVTGRWHFIQEQSGKIELYDIQEDPGELHDLSGDPSYAGLIGDFRQRLAHQLAGGGLPWPEPAIREAAR